MYFNFFHFLFLSFLFSKWDCFPCWCLRVLSYMLYQLGFAVCLIIILIQTKVRLSGIEGNLCGAFLFNLHRNHHPTCLRCHDEQCDKSWQLCFMQRLVSKAIWALCQKRKFSPQSPVTLSKSAFPYTSAWFRGAPLRLSGLFMTFGT